MKNSMWAVSGISALGGGVIIPLIIRTPLMVVAETLVPVDNGWVMIIISVIVTITAVWIGVLITCKYFLTRYIVNSPVIAIRQATMFVFLIITFLSIGSFESPEGYVIYATINLITFTIAFYIFSKTYFYKYLKINLTSKI